MARIGVDLGGTKIEVAVLGPDHDIVYRKRVPTPPGYTDKILAIRALVGDAETELGLTQALVGVGHPGSHNRRTGLIRNANSTSLNGQPLQADLQAALARPVRCANDANCFALSEARDGAGRGARTVFGVILGTGVGGGLVIEGRIHEGHDANGGEWGHMGLPWPEAGEVPGPACKCGLCGCVEAWCSGPALAADHHRISGESLKADDIAVRARSGDPAAMASLDRHSGRVARGLANVVNLIDPEVIVLGGGLSNLPGLAETLQARLGQWTFTDEPVTRVVKNHHGDSSGVRGAAWLWPGDGGAP
jgi:fructokinase